MLSFFFAVMVLACPAYAEVGPYQVTCKMVSVPSMNELLHSWANICYPVASDTFPIHVLGHGACPYPLSDIWHGYMDTACFGDGLITEFQETPLEKAIASYGFVVASYLSCWYDAECYNGQSAFVQSLKTIQFLEQNPGVAPVDLSKAYSVSGHSTGARAALMLGALRDNPAYLASTILASQITQSMRTSLSKINAVIALNPDPMSDPTQNPDIQNFKIKQMPVFVYTASLDGVEPSNSAWENFKMLSTPDKMFVDMHGAAHAESYKGHLEAGLISYFAKYFALGDVGAGRAAMEDVALSATALYSGVETDSLIRPLQFARAGDANRGDGKVAFLVCSKDGKVVPQDYAKYCESATSAEPILIL